jgi:Clp amino terminal domain, pathogenicity island component
MPDLEMRIAEWRGQMAGGGVTNPEVLDELENHLREDIEQRMRAGASAPQAFAAAVERIGAPRVLRSEFAKSGAPHRSCRPNVVRGGCVAFAAAILLINAWTLFQYDLNPVQRSLIFLAVSLITFYVGMLPFRPDLRPGAAVIKFMALLMWVWPLVAILGALQIIRAQIGFTTEMIFWNLYAACAATLAVCHFLRPFNPLADTPWSFTARQTMELARAEASGLYHDFIGTEHLLLGLLKSEPRIVPGVLKKFGVDQEKLRSEIRRLVEVGPAHEVSAEIPLTPRAREALQLAAEEARTRHHSVPSAEHIFLGLLREGGGVAAVALKNLGVRIEKAREIISNEL